MSLIGIITTITAVKKVHDGLYENNEKYRETADRTANDAIDGVEFVRGCASDWFLWATTGIEDGGRDAQQAL